MRLAESTKHVRLHSPNPPRALPQRSVDYAYYAHLADLADLSDPTDPTHHPCLPRRAVEIGST